ncbi:MAG: protein-disulfide reductase DsbD domain-containing protein [Candidatus Acidiferrales bacterium]
MRKFDLAIFAAVILFPTSFILRATPRSGLAGRLAASQSATSTAASVVKPQAYVSLEPVPRARTFSVAVVAEIARGFHINSNKPLDEFLIPTTLTAQLPAGFREIETVYPAGQLLKFAFSPDKPLSVYSGSAMFRMKFEAAADAPLGSQTIPLTLRYQPCNDTACLPPVKVPVVVKLEVAAADAKARPIHPEIFTTSGAKPLN